MRFSQYIKHSLLAAVTSTMVITSAFTPVEAQETQPGFIPVNTTSPTTSKTSSQSPTSSKTSTQSTTNSASRLTTSSRTSSSSVPKSPSVAEEPIVAYGAIPDNQQFDTLESNDGIIITGLGSVEINNGDLVIPAQIDGKQVVEIDDKAFQNKGIERIIFEDGVSLLKIGNNAFQGNKITGDLTIDVETIGDNAFAQNEIQSLRLQGTQQVGNDAFRDNKIQSIEFSPNGDTPVNIGDRSFINNRLSDEIDLSVVADIGDEAFSTNKIRTVQVGEDTVLRDKVFANNGAWVEVKTSSGSDSSRGIETKSYDDKTGQVVDPVSIIVRYLDQDGNSIAPEQRIGDDLVNDTQAFEKGKEATFTPRKIQNYRLDTPEIVFTPDSDGYVIEAKYTYIDQRPTITINRDGIELANGETPTREKLMQGVTAKDKDGNDITKNVKIDTSNVNVDAPGVYDVIYTVVDKNGNERIKKDKVNVGINWAEYEFGGGWQIKDFRYDGDTLRGFSESGEAKLRAGNTDLWLPPVNLSGGKVTKIRDSSWNNGAFYNKGIIKISDWGNITSIGNYAFSRNQIVNLPDSWGSITSIGKWAFYNNQISTLPDDWGKVTRIGDNAFSNNQISTLPDDWGQVTSIGGGTFENNQISTLPDDWGQVTSIGGSAFENNQLSSLPDDWGQVTSIGENAFENNQLSSLPDTWGQVTSIDSYAFAGNQLSSLPDTWGQVTSIGTWAFSNNQLSSLPDDWGQVTSIGDSAFSSNKISTLPDDWGQVTSIGDSAFSSNKISTLPDDWGQVTSIGTWAFSNNQLSSLPDDWGQVTSIGDRAFAYNQLTSLPDDWGQVTSIGDSAFNANQLPANMVFTIKPDNLTQNLVNDIDRSRIPNPLTIITTDRSNPNNVKSSQEILINPVRVTYKYLDENKKEISKSVVEIRSSDEKVTKTPPFIPGYNIPEAQTFTVARQDAQTVDFIYKKSTVKEDMTTNIGLILNNKNEYLIGHSMTGKIHVDRTGSATSSLSKPRIYLSLDPNVYDLSKIDIDFRTHGIDKNSLKIEDGIVSFELESLSPADSKDIAFSVPFKEYVTAAHTPYPINTFIVNKDNQIVRTGNTESFSGYYRMPYERIIPTNATPLSNNLSVVSDYDQTRIEVPGDFPITYVSDDKPGVDVKNSISYNISNYSLKRNIDKYTIRVPLPEYKVHERSSLYDEGKPTRLAKFDPTKNPGWKLSDDGTYVEYVGDNNNTANNFSKKLTLGYPGAVENSITNIEATTIMTPTDKPSTEQVIVTNHNTNAYFARYSAKDGEIFTKVPAGNHWTSDRRINYFYDNTLERNGTFPWVIAYNATHTMKEVVFRDTDLDSRMYYDTIEIPENLGDVKVRVLDSRGADLQSVTLNKDSASRKITFDKNKVMNASELRIELLGDFVKGSTGSMYLTTRLKNPDPKIFESQNTNPEFINIVRFMTEGKELGSVKAHKQVQAAKQEIAAFKEFVGYNDRGDRKTSIITGDKLTYTVGFTPREGFGETITNIQEVDLLPKNVDVVNVEMSRAFSQLPGAKYDIQENYKGTGQTAVIFTASSALPEQVRPGSKFTVGTITVQTTMLTEDKRIDNDVYVKANNTALANTAKPPFEPTVNWSKANVWTSYEASAGMEARKQIRSYGENNKPNLWTGSVTTFPGEKIDYKLRVTNGTDAVRNNLVVYDVLPHVGDVGIPSVRGSQFENTWDTTRKPTLPAGYKIEYYNGATWPKYNGDDHADVDRVLSQLAWSTTPSAKTKAIRITANPGVAMNARSSVEFILPMKANQQNVDAYNNPPADMLDKSAWNSFFWKDNIQTLPIEGNKVENKLKDRPISITFNKIAAGKNTPLKDAQFELRDASNNVVSTAISDAQGRVFFDNVRVKEGFIIKEIKAPRGYQVSSKVLRITSDHIAQGYAKSPAVIDLGNFDNEELPPPPVYGEVEFTKVDADGKPLPGTVFTLSNSDNTYEAIANKDGKVIFANVVPATDYKLEETQPVGRLQPISNITNIKVEGDKTTYLGATVNGVDHAVANDKVKVLLTKLGVNDDRIYNQNGTPKPFGTYQGTDGSKLSGAIFQVIDDATGNVVSTVRPYSYNDTYIENLTPGKVYRLNETQVPTNYEKIDGLDLRFKVDARGALLHPDGTPMEVQNGIYVPNRNKTQESTVTVLKVDQDKNPVAGAVFALQRKENDTWVQVGDTKTSGEDGVVSWNTNDSARYRIVETQAPAGYIGKYVSPEFITQRTSAKTFSYTAVNNRIRPEVAKVEFIAQNLPTREAAMEIRDKNNGSVVEGSSTSWNVVRYLEGAVIEVRENDAQGALIQTITTDSNGKAQITANIDPQKNYVLVETQAPEGYELRTQPLTFNATTRLATDPAAKNGAFTVFVPNYKKNGRIVVSKLNESTGEPITGVQATFEALSVNPVDGQPQDDDIEIDGVFYRPTGRTITQKTSQSAGVASFNNLDYGTYIVRETASPNGYVLDATPALFTVDENNASHTFVFNNTPENPKVDITKYINGHDANSDLTAVWLDNDAETMDVKTVVENTGNTKLEKVTITDAIRDTDDQYINEALKTAMFTIRDADGNLIAENVANGEITLNPGDTVETTVNVASPEKGDMHRDDAHVTGYYGDIEVTDEDPAHAYRIPDVVDFILPATGAVPRFGILFLIVMTMLGVAFGIMRRKNIA